MKYIFTILFLTILFYSKAQKIDTCFVEPCKKKISMRTHYNFRNYSFVLKSSNNSEALVKYAPNLRNALGFGATYYNIALNLLVKLPDSEKKIFNLGNTEYYDIRLNFNLRKFYNTFYYKNYSVFYLKDNDVLISTIQKEPLVTRTDIELTSYGYEMYYVFNSSRYSLNAAYKHTERQKISAGSFLLFSELNYQRLVSDSTIIPQLQKSSFSKYSDIENIEQYSINMLVGYTYNFVKNRLFFSPSLFAGLGYTSGNFDVFTQTYSEKNLRYNLYSRITGGYNGIKYFTGIIFNSKNCISFVDPMKIRITDNFITIFAGYKF